MLFQKKAIRDESNKPLFLVLSFIYCLFQSQALYAENSYQLIFAMDMIRHGDRTPILDIPKDPYPWLQGFGQLTPKGMMQLFNLGKLLRDYYIDQHHLLSAQYRPGEIYVRASDYERILVSAEALLYGLYPIHTGPKLSDHTFALPMGFQPIPVHTVDIKQDSLLLPTYVYHQQFQDLLQQYVYSHATWLAKEKEYHSKIQRWSLLTGYKMAHLNDVVRLGDTLYIRRLYGIHPPSELTEKEVDEIIELAQWVMTTKFKPKPIGEFLAKQFWTEVIGYLTNAVTHSKNIYPKYVLYFGHDGTILGLMSSIGLPLQNIPEYGANFRLELLKDKQDKYWIRMSYNQKLQKLSTCMLLCPLEEFFYLIRNISATDGKVSILLPNYSIPYSSVNILS